MNEAVYNGKCAMLDLFRLGRRYSYLHVIDKCLGRHHYLALRNIFMLMNMHLDDYLFIVLHFILLCIMRTYRIIFLHSLLCISNDGQSLMV